MYIEIKMRAENATYDAKTTIELAHAQKEIERALLVEAMFTWINANMSGRYVSSEPDEQSWTEIADELGMEY